MKHILTTETTYLHALDTKVYAVMYWNKFISKFLEKFMYIFTLSDAKLHMNIFLVGFFFPNKKQF